MTGEFILRTQCPIEDNRPHSVSCERQQQEDFIELEPKEITFAWSSWDAFMQVLILQSHPVGDYSNQEVGV